MNATHNPHPGVALSLSLAWVRFYTFGLSAERRARRLEEITSDVWDQRDDERATGVSDSLISVNTVSRAMRGALDDLAWRLQLEGPFMHVNIPIERVAGALLLILVVALFLSTSAAGYDTSLEGFDSEIRRLADVSGKAASIYSGMQILAGITMIAAAAVFYVHLHARSPFLAAFAAFMLVAAGLMAFVGSAVYFSAADMADEWAANPNGNEAVSSITRAQLMVLEGLSGGLIAGLGLGVYALAIATARLRLVPRALNYVAAVSAAAIATLFVLELTDAGGDWAWFAMIVGLLLMIVWLLVAGLALVFGSSGTSPNLGSESIPTHPA